jgi:hypothetical protein
MPSFGISLISASGSIIESLDIEQKGEFKQLLTSTGAHSEARIYDTVFTISVKGKGDTCPFDAGSSSGLPGGVVTGKGFWTNTTVESKNDDFRGWSATATVYKNAT